MCGALVERATTHTHTVEQVMVCATDAVRHDCNHDFAYNRTASHSYAQSIRYHGSMKDFGVEIMNVQGLQFSASTYY